MRIRRGDIYIADMCMNIGCEQGGIRPVLILQNNKGNKYSPTTIVASITSRIGTKKYLPTHVYLPENIGLKYRSIVLLEQVRVIDKCRLIHKIGQVPHRTMRIIDKRLMTSCGLYMKQHRPDKGYSKAKEP